MKSIFDICKELGMPYKQNYNDAVVRATYHAYKLFEVNLLHDFAYDADDEDTDVTCDIDIDSNGIHAIIRYTGYSIIIQADEFDHLTPALQLAETFQVTKNDNDMVEVAIAFSW